ncbi:MAG: carboxypeptidase regulatory-like domain-containing protein [Clostridia bacterium]|nr:carboxypeptidase regulatory-like domain-containing protein [Clostridia bacterium]
MEYDKCPVIKVDGVIEAGKQFDLEINLPEDNRNVIYGVVKDSYNDPVRDAVVKLIEVVREYGKEERRPVSHTFTDKDGEFVFGPLCNNRTYELQIWVDRVKHCKECIDVKHEGKKCLKGVDIDCDKHDKPEKPEDKPCDDKDDK